MALVGGGSTLRGGGGGLARVLDVNGNGAGFKVAIDNLTMTSGTGILIGEAGTGVIGKDAQRAGIWVGSEFTEMAKSMIDVAGGVDWGGVRWSGVGQMPLSLVGQPADLPPAGVGVLMRRTPSLFEKRLDQRRKRISVFFHASNKPLAQVNTTTAAIK